MLALAFDDGDSPPRDRYRPWLRGDRAGRTESDRSGDSERVDSLDFPFESSDEVLSPLFPAYFADDDC